MSKSFHSIIRTDLFLSHCPFAHHHFAHLVFLSILNSFSLSSLTLSGVGGGPFRPPLSENRDFSGTEPPSDLRPVCKFKFVCCGPVEKKQSALSFLV